MNLVVRAPVNSSLGRFLKSVILTSESPLYGKLAHFHEGSYVNTLQVDGLQDIKDSDFPGLKTALEELKKYAEEYLPVMVINAVMFLGYSYTSPVFAIASTIYGRTALVLTNFKEDHVDEHPQLFIVNADSHRRDNSYFNLQ